MTIQSRITQGATSSAWGEAAVVSVGTFTISTQATGGTVIGSWLIELGDCSGDSTYFSPRPSQISPVTVASGNSASPSWTHTTAAPSSYLFRITTWSGSGQTGDSEVEYREFRAGYANYADAEPCVVTYSLWRDAIDAQAAAGRGRHDNFGGNARGWTGEIGNTGLAKMLSTLSTLRSDLDTQELAVGRIAVGSATAYQIPRINSGATDVEFALLAASSVAPSSANTVLRTNAGATAAEWSLLTASNLSSTAGVAPTQFSAGAVGNVVLGGATAASNAWGQIANSHVSTDAAIAVTKLATSTANYVLKANSGGTANEFGLLTTSNLSSTAAIPPTQLSAGAVGNVILGGATAAANAWGQVANAHIATAAAISVTKLANGTANQVLRTNSGGTANEFALLTTSNLSATAGIVGSQLSSTAAIAPTQLTGGGVANVLLGGATAASNAWGQVTASHIAAAAAIAPTQLSAGGANSVIQGAATTGAQAWTTTPTVASLTTTAQIVAGTYLQAGSSPASIGTIRFPATHTYRVRNTAGDGDVIQFETASAAGNVNIGPSVSMGGTTNLTVLRAYGGNIVFQTEGTIRAYISTTELAPNTAGGITLGSSSKGWGALWCETINFRTDNTYSCGAASNRSSVVYSATPAINTSDKREKTNFSAIPEDVMDVWYYDLDITTRYQWIKSVAEKGEAGARYFVGPPAQDIRDAFDARGLDGTRYGLLCYDAWPEIVEPATETEPEKRHQEAGDRWGVRGEQALWLEAACNRREVTRLTRRIEDLEKALDKQAKKAA